MNLQRSTDSVGVVGFFKGSIDISESDFHHCCVITGITAADHPTVQECICVRLHMCRAQNKDFKMSNHDSQPIPNVVSHLHQLLGHARPLATYSCSTVQSGWNKEATNRFNCNHK